MERSSINDATTITAPQHGMGQLGSVIPRLIETVAAAPLNQGNLMFSKLDINYG